jgi:hypothetical protein
MLFSNMLLLNLIPLIEVTFSTPTGNYTQNPAPRVLSPEGRSGTDKLANPVQNCGAEENSERDVEPMPHGENHTPE